MAGGHLRTCLPEGEASCLGLEAFGGHLGPVATGAEVCCVTCPRGFEHPEVPASFARLLGFAAVSCWSVEEAGLVLVRLASWMAGLSSGTGRLVVARRAQLPSVKGGCAHVFSSSRLGWPLLC